jgi:arylsulfatase A-like enzyme
MDAMRWVPGPVLAGMAALLLLPARAAADGSPRRVVIVSEDGMRPDALTPEVAPAHVELMRQGATARLAETIRQSDTLPSHASMLSGFGVAAHGLWWNNWKRGKGYIHVPTIFSIAREHGLSTAMFVGKPKLRHIARPGTVDHFERPGYFCGSVSRRAAEYLAAARPDVMFVHFSDPDDSGHAKGWMSAAYIKGVRNTDRCLARLLAAIDAAGLAGETLVIVTADHGGHGRNHSGGHDHAHAQVDRQIPWIVRGPGITPGTIIETPINTVDTAATVLSLLHLPAPPRLAGVPRLGPPASSHH